MSRFVAKYLFCTVAVAALLSPQVGDAKNCDKPPAGEVPVVQLRLGVHGNDLPPGVSLVVKNGGLINKGFPAMSADGDRIAVFYFAGSPWVGGYPTLDIYSTESLTLQKRIEIGPRPRQPKYQAPDKPELWIQIERQLIEVNRILAQGSFRPIPKLFDFMRQQLYAPIERLDMRIERVAKDGTEVLIVTSLATGDVELELPMPSIPVYISAENPDNNCVVQGGVLEGWYDPEGQLLVLRMLFGGGRDGCELPEKWLIKRL